MASLALKDSTTSQGYVLSILLHAGIIALAWTGIPFFHRELPVENPPLIVDLVPITDITSAAPPPAPEPAPSAPVAPPEPPKPAPAEAPPAEAMPPPPKAEAPVKEAEKEPPPKVKPTPKPTPPSTKKDDIAMLQNLLKDMQKKQPPPSPQAQASKTPTNNIAPNITDRASMTELDAIRRHIEDCWRIDPGTEGVENMAVDLKVNINPDGSVQRAEILDMGRYFADPQFRTLANSARNAVLGCGNIPISPERYNIFKEITMTFRPQGRIN